MIPDEPLETDPIRELDKDLLITGIFVRAKVVSADKWDSVDITRLSKKSLKNWLRSRGGENEWAESVVYHLLEHYEG